MRAPWVVAWSLWLVGTAMATGSLLLAGREVGVLATIVVGFSTVGALVASRHPSNSIGWVFCATGLVGALQALALAYALESLRAPAMLPGGLVAAWVQEWAWIPLVGFPSVVVLLLFPNGRLPSPGWRPVLWIGLTAMGVASLDFALKPGPLTNEPRLSELTNPFGVLPGAETIGLFAFVSLLVTALVAVASLVVRYRRAGGDQRQQIKWFAYGGTLMGTIVVAGSALWQVSPIAQQLVPLSLVLGPLGAGIGILRYRLYDIDLVINRTLVYLTLTGFLGAVYVGGVVGLSQLFPVGGNDLAVAASTLGVAALISPARRRIQAFVDRRFYRSHYDARRTVEEFSARLRDQVDLDSLVADLQGVVRDTFQPASVGVWLRAD